MTEVPEIMQESHFDLMKINKEGGGVTNSNDERKFNIRDQFFNEVRQFEEGEEKITSNARYNLLIKIWSDTQRWREL